MRATGLCLCSGNLFFRIESAMNQTKVKIFIISQKPQLNDVSSEIRLRRRFMTSFPHQSILNCVTACYSSHRYCECALEQIIYYIVVPLAGYQFIA